MLNPKTIFAEGTKNEKGQPVVKDVSGNVVVKGTGKCPVCGRDHVNTGDGYTSEGQPVVKDATGKTKSSEAKPLFSKGFQPTMGTIMTNKGPVSIPLRPSQPHL